MKLYISAELQPALRTLCAPSPVSARRVPTLWQESAVRGAFAGVAAAQGPAASLIPTVASAPAAAPTAFFAATGGVAALGGVEVPGGVEVQGVIPADLRIDLDVKGGTGTTGTTSTIERVRTVEQMPAAGGTLLNRRGVQVQGTSGLTANDKHDLTAPKPNGGVRGTPPRGRPV
ncbi:hypothetical protein [Dactylosporangium sp. NPDC005555]|uniref:hypothetical protein n=1 Tax=Dactylosporangium sp. NPDC005555 TaxID=3154889 RepID=UPI0033A08802